DIKKCEADVKLASAINTDSVKNLISIIETNSLPSRVIHFSCDYVFDGENGNFSETDKPNPKNNYGQTNFLAEKALLASFIDNKIVRTSAVMSKGGVFFDWLVKSIKEGVELPMFENVYFTPTPISLLNEIIFHVLTKYEEIPQKIIQIVGEKKLNRYEFAKQICLMLQEEGANIKSEMADLKNVPFLKDLSLAQSEFVKKHQSISFDDYLMREVASAKVH
ncbi:MAG: sugar nucleotide-binding protein, partial [Deltaproteobacteria bacterium]|nr:sugar nucleotide-binding protein [Deltaproteobacteria bacterium]